MTEHIPQPTQLDQSFKTFVCGQNSIIQPAIRAAKKDILENFSQCILRDDGLSEDKKSELLARLPSCTIDDVDAQFEGDGVINFALRALDRKGSRIADGSFRILKDGSIVPHDQS